MQPFDSHSQPKIYTVSRLTEKIKQLLEESYPFIWISGEISNLRIPSSGHAYFTLKDKRAQISAVMFAGQLRRLAYKLEDGMTVIALGRLTVYGPRGNYQVILEHAQPQGIGELQIAYEQLKRKLEQEGLFDSGYKKDLPLLPHKIAIITSPSGAALQDILNIANRRYENMHILIIPVRVQGDSAAQEIAKAIHMANTSQQPAAVLVVARGGGSIEDLAAYNSELVARAIFESSIPVVSAVGHETDYTIADFVADLRAPTPSAAAELVVPVKKDLKNRCLQLEQRYRQTLMRLLDTQRNHLIRLTKALVHPQRRIQEHQQRLDEGNGWLNRSMKAYLNGVITSYEKAFQRLIFNKPDRNIIKSKADIALLENRLKQSILIKQTLYQEQLLAIKASLRALNPKAILKRGYIITRTLPQGKVVTDAADLAQGQSLEIQLSKGKVGVTVTNDLEPPNHSTNSS